LFQGSCAANCHTAAYTAIDRLSSAASLAKHSDITGFPVSHQAYLSWRMHAADLGAYLAAELLRYPSYPLPSCPDMPYKKLSVIFLVRFVQISICIIIGIHITIIYTWDSCNLTWKIGDLEPRPRIIIVYAVDQSMLEISVKTSIHESIDFTKIKKRVQNGDANVFDLLRAKDCGDFRVIGRRPRSACRSHPFARSSVTLTALVR
jgi:hypothetical protein